MTAGRFGVAQTIAILDSAIGQSSGATQAALQNGLVLSDLVTTLARLAGTADAAELAVIAGQIVATTPGSDPDWITARIVDATSGTGALTAVQDAAVLVAVASAGGEALQRFAGHELADLVTAGSLTAAQAVTAAGGAASPDTGFGLAIGMMDGGQVAAAGGILAGVLAGVSVATLASVPIGTLTDDLALAAPGSTPAITLAQA